MITKQMKVHVIRSETATTAAVELVTTDENQTIQRMATIPGLSPAEAAAFEINQVVTVTIAALPQA